MTTDGRLPVQLISKDRFRDAITLRRTTVPELARKAGVPPSGIYHLLRHPRYKSARRNVTAPTAAAIERALDVDPGYLFEPEPLPVARNTQHVIAYRQTPARHTRKVRR